MIKPDRSVYSPQDFVDWRASGTLVLTPKFQRRGVWTPAARSYFINSLLRRMPVPPIYLRNVQSSTGDKVIHEVIDGQQRISAVLDYVDGKYRLSASLAPSWAGRVFSKLAPDEQQAIRSYGFSSEIFQGISDEEVLAIFARLNTYSVPLNAQELRNGRFFGRFKQCCYELAHEHLQFWRKHKVFTERRIARMLEVELTSELLVAEIGGMQDKKASIEIFYREYDEAFENAERYKKRFRNVIDTITDAFEDSLAETEFNRPPLFYTLFCAVYHREFGLPKSNLATTKKALSQGERVNLLEAVQTLSQQISLGRNGEAVPKRYERFVAACLRQTDNIRPRQERLSVLYTRAFGGD